MRNQDWAPSRGHATWPGYSGNAYLIIQPPDTLSVSVYVPPPDGFNRIGLDRS